MTTHIYHADTHEYGLHPDCPRCKEHAARPWQGMDRRNLARIARGDLFTSLDRQAHQNLIEHFGDDVETFQQWGEQMVVGDPQ